MQSNQNVLILGFVFPEPKSSAAGGRMMQLIAFFQTLSCTITFASPAADSEFAFPLESIGVEKRSIQLNDAGFDDFIRDLNPDIVLFDRFLMEEQFGWRVAENCPQALRILDTEDLHFLRAARKTAVKEKRSFTSQDLFSDMAKREVASILRCDVSLMVSEYEIELLTNLFRIDPLLLLYFPIWVAKSESLKPLEEREGFIFIGNFLHEPNWDAVQYLKTDIWPLIRKELPNAVLKIYGAYPSQKVLQLHQPSKGFLIEGRAEDALIVMENAKVCLAPLRFGAGIKGKLLEAMAVGTPTVTTAIGAESMHGALPWNGYITDDVQSFVSDAIDLYTNIDVWEKAQENGFEILLDRYQKALIIDVLIQKIGTIQENIDEHRHRNFTGAMLMHHTLQSTKYMSRWIEEKNKK